MRVRIISYGLGSNIHEVGEVGTLVSFNRTRVVVELDWPPFDDRKRIAVDPGSLIWTGEMK